MPPFISYMCCKQLLYEFALIPTTILQGGKLKGYRKHLTQNETVTKHLSQNSSAVTFKSSSGIAKEIIHFIDVNIVGNLFRFESIGLSFFDSKSRAEMLCRTER